MQKSQKREPAKKAIELRQMRLAAAQDALNTLMIKASVEGQHVDVNKQTKQKKCKQKNVNKQIRTNKYKQTNANKYKQTIKTN